MHIKKALICLAQILAVIGMPAGAFAAEAGGMLQHVNTDVGNVASLQRGARNFVNYCFGCHSAKYVRYNRLAEDLFDDRLSAAVRRFPPELRRTARRKLLYLHDAAELRDLRVPPGNRLEALKGRWKGFHSIRINDQWRILFRWQSGNALGVQVVDYH